MHIFKKKKLLVKKKWSEKLPNLLIFYQQILDQPEQFGIFL